MNLKEGLRESEGDCSIDAARLENFRLFDRAEVVWRPGFNVISGPNAQGKTTLLEAVYWVATTRMLRGSRDAEAIRHGARWAQVCVKSAQPTAELSLRIEPGTRKQAFLNSLKLPRAADLIGRVPCVCITANDLRLVLDEPAVRRNFLDLELSQLHAKYLREFTAYKRALDQRNSLLKRSRDTHVSNESFVPWEHQLAQSGSKIREFRRMFLSEIAQTASPIQEFFGGGEDLCLEYAPSDESNSADEALALLEQCRPIDRDRGATTTGPHRDDVAISVNGQAARLFASQGQQRTCVLAIKLSLIEVCRAQTGSPALLLLDDMLSDLDQMRRGRLVDWVVEHSGQAILTCTEESSAGERILERARVFRVEGGSVRAL